MNINNFLNTQIDTSDKAVQALGIQSSVQPVKIAGANQCTTYQCIDPNS